MHSRERFLAALNNTAGTPACDRTPLAHVSALTTLELQESTGCFMPDVHNDPEALVRLCGANHEALGFDAVSFIINYFGEPAALGCSINWGGKAELPVYTSHPWATAEDAVAPADILDRPTIRNYLQVLKIARKRYPQVAVLGKVMGPFSMALVMHGLENVMIAMMDDRDKVTHFVRVAMEVLVKCANAQFDAGADAVAIGEGGAGANMLSPQMYESVLMPLHQEMIRQIKGPTIMHICGDITPRLASLSRIGLKCFNFDWAIKPATMKASSKGFTIMGNVNTGDLLMGKPEDIAKQVYENLDAGVDIISPGCAVSPKCPNANIIAMADAIKQWHGRK